MTKLTRPEMSKIQNWGIENWNIGCSLLENIGFWESEISKIINQGIRNWNIGCSLLENIGFSESEMSDS